MKVSDTILYVPEHLGGFKIIPVHFRTKEKVRLTDGRRHPVRIIQPVKKGVIHVASTEQ